MWKTSSHLFCHDKKVNRESCATSTGLIKFLSEILFLRLVHVKNNLDLHLIDKGLNRNRNALLGLERRFQSILWIIDHWFWLTVTLNQSGGIVNFLLLWTVLWRNCHKIISILNKKNLLYILVIVKGVSSACQKETTPISATRALTLSGGPFCPFSV